MGNPPVLDALRSWQEFTSRENCLKNPLHMNMLGYLSMTHGLPKYAFGRTGLMYHYSDAAGVLGVITTRRLWATDIEFLNDPSEGKFFPAQFLRLMSANNSFGADGLRVLAAIEESMKQPRPYRTMSVSFCASGDLLSQWRGYGSFGAGYAMGFDLQEPPHPQIGSLFDVTYGQAGLAEVATDLLDIYTSSVRDHGWYLDDMGDQAAALLRSLSATFKDPSYSEEQEIRIVVPYGGPPKILKKELPLSFRTRGADIIPFMPIPWSLILEDEAPLLRSKES